MIDISKVSSVYYGQDGKCCCGCAGKHVYHPDHVEYASKKRGYAVDRDEVKMSTVKYVVGMIEKNPACIQERDDEMITAVVGTRLYIAYLVH